MKRIHENLRLSFAARIIIYVATALLIGAFYYLYLINTTQHPNKEKLSKPVLGILIINTTDTEPRFLPKTVYFNLKANDFVIETAWIDQESAFLGIDRNGNDRIDNSSELFGSDSTNGFQDLKKLDSNNDDKINKKDIAWKELIVWRDQNNDGSSVETEMSSIDQAGIESIGLGEKSLNKSVGESIIHSYSTIKLSDNTRGKLYLVDFKSNPINSQYIGDYDLDARALFLPSLRGYGILPALFIAVSIDKDLMSMMTRFVDLWTIESFTQPETLQTDIENILFQWAGVSTLTPDSRGPNIDARRLVFLEKFMNNPFLQQGKHPNPKPVAASLIEVSWYRAYHNHKAQLLTQLGAEIIYKKAHYNPLKGEIAGDLSIDLTGLKQYEYVALSQPDPYKFWLEVADYIHYTKGLSNLTVDETAMISEAVSRSKSSVIWEEISKVIIEERYKPEKPSVPQ